MGGSSVPFRPLGELWRIWRPFQTISLKWAFDRKLPFSFLPEHSWLIQINSYVLLCMCLESWSPGEVQKGQCYLYFSIRETLGSCSLAWSWDLMVNLRVCWPLSSAAPSPSFYTCLVSLGWRFCNHIALWIAHWEELVGPGKPEEEEGIYFLCLLVLCLLRVQFALWVFEYFNSLS